jgi:nucleoside 2-deoxyribosyltransferase
MPPLRTSSTAPKPFVFVVMPFDAAFDDAYEAAIKPACEAAGAYAERVDDQIFQGNILQRLYNQIAKADLIVADTTGRNVNVLYEIGYAHALRKDVILVTRGSGDVVFDPARHPQIVYARLVDLRGELERKVRNILETTEQRTAPIAIPVTVMIDDVVLDPVIARDVTITTREADSEWFGFHVVVQNPALRVIRPLDLQVGVITPPQMNVSIRMENVRTAEMRLGPDATLEILRTDFTLLPGAGIKLWVTCHPKRKYEDGEAAGSFAVRVLTAESYYDFAFNVKIARPAPAEGPGDRPSSIRPRDPSAGRSV